MQISHRALTNLLHSMRQEPGLTAQDILLSVTTICFDIAALEIYLPLVVGACVVLASREATMDAKQLANLIEQSGATVMQATPATWRLLLAAGWQGNSQLKILCGGEALPRELADQLLVRSRFLWNMYGPTETTIWSAVHQVQPGDKPVHLGRAIANTQLYILDPHHLKTGAIEPVPIGVPGELCIGGLGLARGYLNRIDLTQERFIPNSLRSPSSSAGMSELEDSESLYRTGDLARYLPDGSIEYIGRVDHQVKIRGFRIELGEIESAILQHSAVRETVVIAREDTPGDQRLVAYVVARSPDAPSLTYQEQTQQWQKIWDAAYSQPLAGQDATFNIAGWNNSYTGSLTAAGEMREWVDHTVTRILSLHPRRVLEVGCGTGLLLFRIAPHCDHYLGIDQSETAIGHIREQLRPDKQWSHVQLDNRAVDTLGHLNVNAFDTVIINSVVQYFPSVEYLVKVLEQTIKQVKPEGSIFIGDIRSLPLLQAFHTSVQLYQASDMLAIADLQERIRERVAHEGELLIDPTFFTALKQHLPAINRVEIQLKRGHYHNELTRFRYDVILHIGTQSASVPLPTILSNERILPDWQIWQPHLTVSAIHQLLEATKPVCFGLSHIPNSRLSTEMAALEQLADNSQLETVGMLRQALQNSPIEVGIDPEDWWQLEQNLPYRVLITESAAGSANQNNGSYDVEFQRSYGDRSLKVLPPSISQPQLNLQPWQVYANTPFQGKQNNHLIPELQALLRSSLPDYMMPSAFVILDTLPLTPNGKVDRQALPAPNRERSPSQSTFIAPRTPIEKQLGDIWAEILGIAQVGVEDNFFELGGHSLLIAQMVAQVQSAFDVELSLFHVFTAPTIQDLATVIGDRQSGTILTHTALDLRAEAVLDPTILSEGTLETSVHEPANVLLTGATGFLGAFLLHELLEQTQATVYCLVRAATVEAGAQRLQHNLSSYSLWQPNRASRIIPVLGDLSLPLLGLSIEQFRALAATLDSIYHSGGFVNFIYPYSALKAVNVLSTEEVLRLAAQVKVKPVHFISTIGVFSPIAYQNGQIIRQEQPEPSEGLYGYTQSKWVAEKLLAIAKTRGIPSAVYRPAWIEGHSQTGICNRSDFFRSLIKGCIQLGVAPDWGMPVDLAPIDYVSRAIVHLSLQNTASEQAFNFSNPQAISWHQLVNWINKFGYSIQQIPYEQWIAEVRERVQHQSENALNPFSTFLFEKVAGQQMTIPEIYFQTNSIQFDCQPIVDGLAGLSVSYPPIDDTLLTTYFQQFVRSGFLAPPV